MCAVEWRSIGSLLTRKRVKAKKIDEQIPVYAVTNNKGFVLSSEMHEFTIHSEDTSNYSVVEHNDFAYNPSRLNIGSISYFKSNDKGLISPMYVVFHADEKLIIPEYLYVVIKSKSVKNKIEALKEVGARFRFDFSRWDLINIPIPSLAKQQEIVSHLDTFTTLISNLESELDMRRKQYEHYRNQLFGDTLELLLDKADKGEIEVSTLSEVGTFTRGRRFVRTDIMTEGTPCIHYGDMYTYYGVSAKTTPTFLLPEVAAKLRFAQENDVVIVGAGENNEDIGIGVAWLGNEDVAVHDACYIFKHKMNPLYISYYLRTDIYHKQIKKYVSSGKICSISSDGIGKSIIPIPSSKTQQQIVEKLDAFEQLIQSLETEIKLRKQQYEYYREKLLTFE